MTHQLLIIGHTFPEPTTTGAGTRMMQLVELFLEAGFEITFASTASLTDYSISLPDKGIAIQTIALNSDSFDALVLELQPAIVVYDRFMTEEQFGWRVSECCPNALRILDTEDLHFLRKARQEAIQNGRSASEAYLYTETAKRELASMLRCDLSLIISEAEKELLRKQFDFPSDLLHYLPFLVNGPTEKESNGLLKFEERQHFVTVGNLMHAPNVDSVLQLHTEIWPKIRKQLPSAQLHIYGAYAPKQISQLHNPTSGFLIKGWVENLDQVMQNTRICLAPLRFGAGLKGKIIDAMQHGTPVVTTEIGAEGIHGALPFPGIVANDPDSFVAGAVQLYSRTDNWQKTQEHGFEILRKRFQKREFSEKFLSTVASLCKNIEGHRESNFIGQVIQHQTLQSHRYMSKWIIEKNKSQQ